MSKGKIFNRSKCCWTQDEIQFLLDNFGELEMRKISKTLQRSEMACMRKFYDLNGSADIVSDNIVLSTDLLAEALGVSNKTILNWVQVHSLPFTKLYRKNSDKKNGVNRRYFFLHYKVLNWIKDNTDKINFANVKLGVIEDEPKWFYEKVKEAQKSNPVKRPKNWLKSEDEFLFNEYFYNNRTVEDIAQSLQRPSTGAQRRLTVLRKNAEKEGFVFERTRGAGGRTRIISENNSIAL